MSKSLKDFGAPAGVPWNAALLSMVLAGPLMADSAVTPELEATVDEIMQAVEDGVIESDVPAAAKTSTPVLTAAPAKPVVAAPEPDPQAVPKVEPLAAPAVAQPTSEPPTLTQQPEMPAKPEMPSRPIVGTADIPPPAVQKAEPVATSVPTVEAAAAEAPVAAVAPMQPVPAPAETVAAPSAAEQKLAKHIQWLSDKAEAARKAKKLTTPKGESAVDYYQQILQIDSENAVAKNGMNNVADTYVGWGRTALSRGQLGKAKSYRSKANGVVPGSGAALDGGIAKLEAAARSRPARRVTRQSAPRREEKQTSFSEAVDDMINLRQPKETEGGASILDLE